MALRVLLADESSTIKKVFQLALQDFAVEVRPVNIGVDVMSVAMTFKPDIIFADVLLQKKNGYEVSAEIKQSAEMKATPIVLMWSGFMEFDEDKFQASKANAQLEKPFDVAALRKLVTELVPRTQNQRISQFLSYPQKIDEDAFAAPPGAAAKTAPAGKAPAAPQTPAGPGVKSGTDKFRLNLSPEELEPTHVPVEYEMPGEDADEFAIRETKRPATAKPSRAPSEQTASEIELDLTRGTNISIDFTGISAPPIPDQEPSISFGPSTSTGIRVASPPPPPPPPVAPAQFQTPQFQAPAFAGPSPAGDPMPAPAAAVPQLTEEQLEQIIRGQSAAIIESVAWKVIPEIATQIIERELSRLLKERDAF